MGKLSENLSVMVKIRIRSASIYMKDQEVLGLAEDKWEKI